MVATRGARAARSLLDARGLRYRTVRTPDRVTFLIGAPGGADETSWACPLGAELRDTGVPVVMYRVP